MQSWEPMGPPRGPSVWRQGDLSANRVERAGPAAQLRPRHQIVAGSTTWAGRMGNTLSTGGQEVKYDPTGKKKKKKRLPEDQWAAHIQGPS